MPKIYHSVPLDEEDSLNGLQEKKLWTDRGAISTRFGGMKKHWAWLAHAILLSISMTLFTLSFCSKSINVTDPKVLEKIATYCGCYRGNPERIILTDTKLLCSQQ
jgi:hypothetical protein